MGLKELCERVGRKYEIIERKDNTLGVSLYRQWKYKDDRLATLDGLFKELYGNELLADIFKNNNPFLKLIDKDIKK